ncbi:MAG: aldehyde dehydrogenase family protein, partial [Deltaproteobacteria bacterium]|nr:aldehyde dehydrogenase family protein [Deltaproteobacteria bacterium]
MAGSEDAARAVATAKADPEGWRTAKSEERREILSRVAMELRLARADLIGAGEERVPPEVLRAAAETGFYIARAQVA